MIDKTAHTTLTDGSPVSDNHKDIKANGQQKGYVVLSAEERAKGYIRPVRYSYRHVGPLASTNPLRDLTPEEQERYAKFNYVKFEEYPESEQPKTGSFWTQERLDQAGKGCDTVTDMATPLAETYARNPRFYGGTFCAGCKTHFPIAEFIWDGTDERVGS